MESSIQGIYEQVTLGQVTLVEGTGRKYQERAEGKVDLQRVSVETSADPTQKLAGGVWSWGLEDWLLFPTSIMECRLPQEGTVLWTPVQAVADPAGLPAECYLLAELPGAGRIRSSLLKVHLGRAAQPPPQLRISKFGDLSFVNDPPIVQESYLFFRRLNI